MRLAIISDIHSNLEALTAAMREIDALSVDHIVCLGDIVGYGADPDACVRIIRERCTVVVAGNHDAAVAQPWIADSFTTNARTVIQWTRAHVAAENIAYLSSLPLVRTSNNLLFVHSSPCEPEQWHYIVDEFDARPAFRCFGERLCFVGHSHFPGVYTRRGRAQEAHRDEQTMINVGSVGQPRDGDCRLCFGLFDTEEWAYRVVRAEYDVAAAANKILEAQLPRALAQRLYRGT